MIFGSFVTLTILAWRQPFALVIFVPAIVLITFLNLRFTFFCDACGKMSHFQQWFSSTYHTARDAVTNYDETPNAIHALV